MTNRHASDWSAYIYLFRHGETDLYKVGSSNNVQKRLKAINRVSPDSVTLVEYVWVERRGPAERFLHKRLKDYHVKQEWFRLPSMEVWREALAALLYHDVPEVEPPTGKPGRPRLKRIIPKNITGTELAKTLGISRQRAFQIIRRYKEEQAAKR